MKKAKSILCVLLCICMVLSSSVTAFAEEATGSITIENQSGTNASVAGKTLNLFKIFSATTDGSNISYQWVTKDGVNMFESFFFGENGVIGKETGTIHDVVEYISGLKDDSFAFSQMAAALHTYIHSENIEPDATSGTVAADATSYTFSNLELGYYLVYDATKLATDSPAVRSAAMLTHSGESKTIKLKAYRPHIEKTVNDSDTSTPDWKLGTTASVGETVTFRIVTMIPNHDLYGENYTFEITDSMSDKLQLNPDSIKVTVTEPTVADDTDGEASEAELNYIIGTEGLNEGVDFKIVLKNITELKQDSVIEITYDAKVLASADFKNTNTATLTYSNDPNNLDSTGSVDSTANVLLWQCTLTKYMEDTNGNPSAIRLAGAEFEIYSKSDLENPLKFTTTELETAEGVKYLKYTYDPDTGTVTTLKTLDQGDDGKTDVGTTDGGNLGQILIFGLGEGSYVIRETKAPDGYQIANGDFEFTVSDTIGITGTISNAEVSTAERSKTPGKFTRVSIMETDQKYYLGITNAPGSALPETGGIGTTVFTVAGILLMAGAVTFFTLRKRSSAA